uniref:Putative L-type lectin-domain containing receptor kinase S.7 n=1 Tax=Anthurium amnicola TaxID=1678845 RepID=A0A1D1ZIA5_9ARAE
MPNGSLDKALFEPKAAGEVLTWRHRRRVLAGVASALAYLHRECERQVIHRDVKSSNILLDSELKSKVADFGLARILVRSGEPDTVSAVAGSFGYMAPECACTRKVNEKVDVYSFGVVALEIACGRRAIDHQAAEEEKEVLVGWMWGLYGRQALLDGADERLHAEYDEVQMERLMVVGLWCAHPDPSSRPPMRQVMAALNLETLPLPAIDYGPWAPRRREVAQLSSQSASSSTSTSAVPSGVNRQCLEAEIISSL